MTGRNARKRPALLTSIGKNAAAAGIALIGLAAASQARADVNLPSSSGSSNLMFGGAAGPDQATGTMQHSVPLPLPRARGSWQPELSLAYSSGAADGEAGYGWGLTMPVIERRPRSGPIGIPNTERFTYNGQPLAYVCTFGGSGGPGTCPASEVMPTEATLPPGACRYFRLQRESLYARFFLCDGWSDAEWVVQLRSGVELHFGEHTGSAPSWGGDRPVDLATTPDNNAFRVARYQLSWARDSFHNFVYYRWRKLGTRGLVYLTDIFDTEPVGPSGSSPVENFAHHAQLDWEPVPFRTTSYGGTERRALDMRLTRVVSASKRWLDAGPRVAVRGWDLKYLAQRSFNYSPQTSLQGPLLHHSFLHRVEPFGCKEVVTEVDGVVPPTGSCQRAPGTTFGYEGAELRTGAPTHLVQPVTGTPDPVAQQRGMIFRHRWYEQNVTEDPEDLHDQGLTDATVMDINGDGVPDLVQGQVQHESAVDPGTGQITIGTHTAAAPASNANRVYFGSIDKTYSFGCLKVDANFSLPGTWGQRRSNLLGSWGPGISLSGEGIPALLTAPPAGSMAGCWHDNPSWTTQPIGTVTSGPSAWAAGYWYRAHVLNPGVCIPTCEEMNFRSVHPLRRATFADINGDGLPDALGVASTRMDIRVADEAPHGTSALGVLLSSAGHVAFSLHRGRQAAPEHEELRPAALRPFWAPSVGPGGAAYTPAAYYAPYGIAARGFGQFDPADDYDRHYMSTAYTDVNGDGVPDFIAQDVRDFANHPGMIEFFDPANYFSTLGPVTIRPGDGYGNFKCDPTQDSQNPSCQTFPGETATFIGPHYELSFFGGRSPTGTSGLKWGENTYFHDVTGDGLADIVQVRTNRNDPDDGTVRVWINSDGHNFHCAGHSPADPLDCVFARLQDVDGDNEIRPTKLTFADMDANGVDDIVVLGPAGAWVVPVLQKTPSSTFARAPRPGLLISVDNGVGAITEVHYETTQELAAQAVTAGQPWSFQTPQVLSVVTKVRTIAVDAPTMERSFTYRDPAYDPWERATLGFRHVRTQAVGEQAVTDNYYWFGPCQRLPIPANCLLSSDDEPQKAVVGKLVRSDRWIPAGARPIWLTSTEYRYETLQRQQDPAFPSTIEVAVHAGHAYEQITHVYDGNLSVSMPAPVTYIADGDGVAPSPTQPGAEKILRKQFDTDPASGLTLAVREGTASSWLRITSLTYGPPRSDWQAPVAQRQVTSQEFGAARVTDFEYRPDGALLRVLAHQSGAVPLDRHHRTGAEVAPSPVPPQGPQIVLELEHDAYGNMVSATSAPSANAPTPKVEITFDPDYAELPERMSQYATGWEAGIPSHTTFMAYDRGRQLVTATVAPNGSVSTIEYDGFGRITRTTEPAVEGTSASSGVSIEYRDGGRKQRTLRYHSVDRTEESFEFFDALGRPRGSAIRAETIAGPNAWSVVGLTAYDQVGRVSGVHDPYFWGSDPMQVTPSLPANSANIRYIYDGFSRRIRTDRWANPTATIEAISYLPLGEEISDAEQLRAGSPHFGNKIRVQRDELGRTRRVDKVLGAQTISEMHDWSPSGDSTVETITRTNGAETLLRHIYRDSAGRTVRNVEENSGEWRYVWDAQGNLVGTSDPRGCGKNMFYDGLARLVAEDFSPCEAHHAPYSAPTVASGYGTEAWYLYDSYEPGQVSPSATFDDIEQNAIGNLTSVVDRGAHTRINYDRRGRVRKVAKRIVKPGAADPDPAARFTSHWFQRFSEYEEGNALLKQTTGADVSELLAGGESWFSQLYDQRGLPKTVLSNYRALVQNITYDAAAKPLVVTYGDLASTKTTLTYDDWNRLRTETTSRLKPSMWNSGNGNGSYVVPPTANQQLSLANITYTLDYNGSPTIIDDLATATQWPNGAKPLRKNIDYDNEYRAKTTAYTYYGSNAYVSPFQKERTTGDFSAVPLANATTRVASQTIAYDWKGDMTSFTTPAAGSTTFQYDRALGSNLGYDPQHRSRLVSASGMAATYDEAGNLVDLRVSRPGATCSVGSVSRCGQHYRYDWDEVGQLQRARRWDFASSVPASTPAYPTEPSARPIRDMFYSYSQGQRVLKEAADTVNPSRFSAEVFDSLRLNSALYRSGDNEYDRTPATETVYLAGIVRVRHQPGLPSFSNTPQHLYLSLGDHLGSTSVIIDMESSEVAEKATYMAYGAIESDHRPARWADPREEYKFTGKEEDTEVGLTYFGARYYHARLGRFISADPLAVHTTRGDPNPYAYVRGRVFAATDPFGLDGKSTMAPPQMAPPILGEIPFARLIVDILRQLSGQPPLGQSSSASWAASTFSAYNTRTSQLTIGIVKATINAGVPWRSTTEVVASNLRQHTPMAGSAAAFAQGLGHGYMSKCAASTPIPIGARVAGNVDAQIGKPPANDVMGAIGQDIGSVIPDAIVAVTTAGASSLEQVGGQVASEAALGAAEGGGDGMTTLYRAVSEAELLDVGASGGLRAGPGTMGNKLFAESARNASSWGRSFARFDKQPFFILRARVPNSVASQMQRWQSLDGIGPARSAEGPVLDLLNQHGVFDVLGANPIF